MAGKDQQQLAVVASPAAAAAGVVAAGEGAVGGVGEAKVVRVGA